uniref:NADH dehydrogenase subunit 6 n=1 Tax=Ornithodoros asperus TaxID=1453431 RepID=UPI0022374415|nr:NADH dehydrogenase subunit 6 [Ornithodoros asperus]UYB78753.1 NADH dehydrogenase subunit 6 [Ornithodoros asperus]UYB78766.1 NADH dehydrogenase subunit 6 [Ornithodoros asperus]
MKLLIIFSTLFISSLHPISMIMIMIMTALLLVFFMYLILKFSWFPLITTLLLLGGLLVIFLYITSLTPNKKFNFKKLLLLPFPIYLFHIMYMKLPILIPMNPAKLEFIFMKFFNNMLILMMFYLLVTLMAIMNLIQTNLAPIKVN